MEPDQAAVLKTARQTAKPTELPLPDVGDEKSSASASMGYTSGGQSSLRKRRAPKTKQCAHCGAPNPFSLNIGDSESNSTPTESDDLDPTSPPPSPTMFETIFYEARIWPSHSGKTWRGWFKHKGLVVYLLTKWALQLILAAGPLRLCRWVWLLGRIIVFVMMLLLQVFIPMVFHYYSNSNIIRDIPYSDNRKTAGRSVLDVYLPKKSKDSRKKSPVVIFFVGGAWIVGYKAWGALVGRLLSSAGILCFHPDYRNFPQATITDMLDDTDMAITWIQNNVEAYGGDPENVLLVGQSAGAHLTLTCLLRRKLEESNAQAMRNGKFETSPLRPRRERKFKLWSTRAITGWVGLSGPYNLVELLPHFQTRGLYQSVMNVVLEASQCGGIPRVSPIDMLDQFPDQQLEEAARTMPPLYLYHGTKDKSVPCWSSVELSSKLRAYGFRVACKLLEGATHTQPIIEGPVDGDDAILHDLLYLVYSGTPHKLPPTGGFSGNIQEYLDEEIVPESRLEEVLKNAPHANPTMLKIAGIINPF